jgi:hypothetical protein
LKNNEKVAARVEKTQALAGASELTGELRNIKSVKQGAET